MTSGSPFHGIFSNLRKEEPEQSLPSDPFGFGSSQSDDDAEGVTDSKKGEQSGRLAVDIYEQDDYYIIKAPIAGVRLSDLDIEVNENTITIRGHRRQTDDLPKDQYYLQECFWGAFSRSVTLPMQIDPRKVRATFNKESILKVLIPKEEKIKIVKINEV